MTSREGIAPVTLAASVIIGVSGAGLLGARAQPGKRGENRAARRSTIAFVSTRHDPTADPTVDPQHALLAAEIYLMDGDGTNPRRLTENTAFDGFPSLSPDGKTIVFTSHAVTDNPVNSATTEIYVIASAGTGTPARLTNNTEEERAPAWSPDGKRIVFCCRRGGPDFEICVMNGDGTGQVELTDNDVPDLTPSWSPDGKKIVFHRRVGGRGQFQLFVINADGTGEKQLTFPPGLNAFPNWGEA